MICRVELCTELFYAMLFADVLLLHLVTFLMVLFLLILWLALVWCKLHFVGVSPWIQLWWSYRPLSFGHTWVWLVGCHCVMPKLSMWGTSLVLLLIHSKLQRYTIGVYMHRITELLKHCSVPFLCGTSMMFSSSLFPSLSKVYCQAIPESLWLSRFCFTMLATTDTKWELIRNRKQTECQGMRRDKLSVCAIKQRLTYTSYTWQIKPHDTIMNLQPWTSIILSW